MHFDDYGHTEGNLEQRRNISNLRHVFFTRAQGKSESVGASVADLKNKTKDREVGQFTDLLIRECIVCGVANGQVRAILLRRPELSLCKAVDICRADKDTQTHQTALHEESRLTKTPASVTSVH